MVRVGVNYNALLEYDHKMTLTRCTSKNKKKTDLLSPGHIAHTVHTEQKVQGAKVLRTFRSLDLLLPEKYLYCVEWDVKLYYTIPREIITKKVISHFLTMVWYGILEFNVPLDTI